VADRWLQKEAIKNREMDTSAAGNFEENCQISEK
jgi:hypothetical protein